MVDRVIDAVSPEPQPETGADGEAAGGRRRFWTLTLGCIGVVYGDIGTSPLYAIKESLLAAKGNGALTGEIVLGVEFAGAVDADHHRHAEIRHAHHAHGQ